MNDGTLGRSSRRTLALAGAGAGAALPPFSGPAAWAQQPIFRTEYLDQVVPTSVGYLDATIDGLSNIPFAVLPPGLAEGNFLPYAPESQAWFATIQFDF
jgi:hypothetical protein